MSNPQNEDMPQDPRLAPKADQNHLFNQPEIIEPIFYQSKIRNTEEGYAHEQYQQVAPQSNDIEPEHDYYSQTVVQEIPQQASAAYSQKPYGKDTSQPRTTWQRFVDFCQTKWWLVLLLLISIAAFSIAATFFFSKSQPTNTFSGVTASAQAPVTVANNGQGVWKVNISNTELTEIQDVNVELTFDKTFTFVKAFGTIQPKDSSGKTYVIPSIPANSTVTVEFSGTLTGDIDELSFLSGKYTFTASDLKTPISRNIQAVQTKITAGEVRLEINVPATAQDGTIQEITVTITNQSEKDVPNVELQATYPNSQLFEYQSSELTLSTESSPRRSADKGNNIWTIANLPKLRTQTLLIRGKFSGPQASRIPFKFSLVQIISSGNRTISELEKEVLLVVQPIAATIRFNNKETSGVFDPEDTLNVQVDFTNQSDRDLQNLQASVDFVDPANLIDFSTIRYNTSEGNVDGSKILFRGSGVPQLVNLPAKGSGTIQFSVQVKKLAVFTSGSIPQNSFILTPQVTISSSQIQSISAQGKGIKANGDIKLDQAISCQKDTTGSETICKVTWSLKNRQNNIANVLVETTTNLPANSWSDSTVKASQGDLTYNSNTGKISWNTGRVQSYAGYTNPVVTVNFEFRIKTPEGGNTTLFSAPRVTGEDEFTGQKYNFTGLIGRP